MYEDSKFAFITESNAVDDLHSKSKFELKDLLYRQNNLLKNKAVVNKLEDKGAKIKTFRDKIENELKLRDDKLSNEKEQLNVSNALEWRDSKKITIIKGLAEIDETNVLKILSENVHIMPKTHIRNLVEKEKDPHFSYKPNNLVVDEKIKKVVPQVHTSNQSMTNIKTIHLEESLELLTQQVSSLKILGNTSRRKRVEECIDDRINEKSFENDDPLEEIEAVDEEKTEIIVSVQF